MIDSISQTSLFLIVTPSFNQAQFIQQTIDSVLNQKSVNIDVAYVVMDGKSTDETVLILKKYDRELNWFSEKDKGQTDAINKGIKSLSSKFQVSNSKYKNIIFAYINSDDFYLPGAFQRVTRAFQDHPEKQWLVGDAIIVDEKNKEIQKPIQFYKQIMRLMPSWILLILNPYPQPSTFIHWNAVQEVGSFTETLKYTMDYEYWLRLRKKFGTPIFLNKPLSAFRIHGLSKGGSQFEKQFDEEFQVAKQFTSNQVMLFLHKLHNFMIKLVYRILK